MEKNKKKFETVNVIVVSAAHMVHDIYSSFLAPILPLLIEKLSISYSMASLLPVFQRLPSLISPFLGVVVDRLSIRYFLILAPSITAISMSLLGAASSYVVLAILLFTMGVSSIFFHIPAASMIKKLSHDKIGTGMSFYMLGGEIARTIGPILILSAVSMWGLERTYYLIPIGIFSSFMLYLRIGKINLSQHMREEKIKKINVKSTLKDFIPIFTIIAFFLISRGLLKACLSTFLPSFIIEVRNGSLWFGGIALSIFQAAGAFATIFSGMFSDKVGRKKILLITAILAPVLMLCFLMSKGALAIFFLLLLGFAIFASSPVILAFVNDKETERSGLVNGVYLTINFLASSLCVFFSGLLIDFIGMSNAFYISAFIAFLAVIPILTIKD